MNKAQIMRRAWEIVRTLVGTLREKLSKALRQAWAEAKAPAKKPFNGEAEIRYHFADTPAYVPVYFRLWENYGKRRIYFDAPTGRAQTNLKGYIDLDNNNEVVITKQNTRNINKTITEFMNTYEFA